MIYVTFDYMTHDSQSGGFANKKHDANTTYRATVEWIMTQDYQRGWSSNGEGL